MIKKYIFVGIFFCGCVNAELSDRFNYILGTQTIGSKYQFTEKARLLETAEEILKLGSNILKFQLDPRFAENNYSGSKPGFYGTLTELAKGDPSISEVFDMPFYYYFMWVNPMQKIDWWNHDGYTKKEQEIEYREIYDLTCYLLKKYNGSGKNFYYGNWEGDWALLGSFERTGNPKPQHVKNMILWLNNRQRAVDDAKRDTPHQEVDVFHYVEVNLVEKGIRGLPCLTTEVLPKTRVDYVSYSAYEMGEDHNLQQALKRTLDFIEKYVPPKKGFSGKRVFVGEFGYQGNVVGEEFQTRRTMEFIRSALDWGSPFILHWQLYDNEFVDGRYNGYWLIDDKRKKWPIYYTFKKYFTEAKTWDFKSFPSSAKAFFASPICNNGRDVKKMGFESGELAPWGKDGDEVSIVTNKPYSGKYHLRLAADGKPEAWAVAHLRKEAMPGETWEASIYALRKKGVSAKLKLEFYDKNKKRVRELSVTGVESGYMPMSVRGTAPEGTVQVYLVAAVEYASAQYPVIGYFDDACLKQILLK